eukprot:m.262889 g.262889  ORF g.262889 m.262889 type:complete len:247 (+) comp47551_c0_seq1:223-963(+)
MSSLSSSSSPASFFNPLKMRLLHRRIAKYWGVLLVWMALTGGIWAIRYRVLGAEKSDVKWMVHWHQGDVMQVDDDGIYIKAPYCIMVGLITFTFSTTGILLQCSRKTSVQTITNPFRRAHHVISLVIGIPITMMATTGGLWAFLRYWAGVDKQSIKWLIWLHQGWFESLWGVYPPLLMVCVLALATSGSDLVWGWSKRLGFQLLQPSSQLTPKHSNQEVLKPKPKADAGKRFGHGRFLTKEELEKL